MEVGALKVCATLMFEWIYQYECINVNLCCVGLSVRVRTIAEDSGFRVGRVWEGLWLIYSYVSCPAQSGSTASRICSTIHSWCVSYCRFYSPLYYIPPSAIVEEPPTEPYVGQRRKLDIYMPF